MASDGITYDPLNLYTCNKMVEDKIAAQGTVPSIITLSLFPSCEQPIPDAALEPHSYQFPASHQIVKASLCVTSFVVLMAEIYTIATSYKVGAFLRSSSRRFIVPYPVEAVNGRMIRQRVLYTAVQC